jgi:hypothetical protein
MPLPVIWRHHLTPLSKIGTARQDSCQVQAGALVCLWMSYNEFDCPSGSTSLASYSSWVGSAKCAFISKVSRGLVSSPGYASNYLADGTKRLNHRDGGRRKPR